MYRTASKPEEPPAFPAELDYIPRRRRFFSGAAAAYVVFVPVAVGAAVGAFAPPAAVPTMILTAVVAYASFKKRDGADAVRLTIDGEWLEVDRPGARRERLRLADLSDVVFDTKTIQPVFDGPSLLLPIRVMESRVGPEIDRVRIVLQARERRIPLTREYLSHTETVGEIAGMRVFLRRNGWVPEDERERVSRRSRAPKRRPQRRASV